MPEALDDEIDLIEMPKKFQECWDYIHGEEVKIDDEHWFFLCQHILSLSNSLNRILNSTRPKYLEDAKGALDSFKEWKKMADPQADKDKKISRDALLRMSSNKDLIDALNAMERRLSRLEEAAAAKPLPGDWATSKQP